MSGELAYLAASNRGGFERPYGWAWLLMLAAELARNPLATRRAGRARSSPSPTRSSRRFTSSSAKATYPIRVGTHFNTAFAVALALEYATVVQDETLASLLRTKARAWYANDRDCQAWEPGGDDFLSSALMEAECMRRVLGEAEFARWFDAFLPRLAEREPRRCSRPPP